MHGELAGSADVREQLASVSNYSWNNLYIRHDNSAVEDELSQSWCTCQLGVSACILLSSHQEFAEFRQHHVSPGFRYLPVIKLLELWGLEFNPKT